LERSNFSARGNSFGRKNQDEKRSGGKQSGGFGAAKSTRSSGSDSIRKFDASERKTPRYEDRRKHEHDSSAIRKVDENENMVEGRNPVIETLKSDRTVEKLYVAKGAVEGSIKKIIAMARDKGIIVNEVDKIKLDNMSTTGSHQGVIALVTPYVYFEVEDILAHAAAKGEVPFIIMLDEIEDPHNLGSVIRSVNVLGAHGVIIPKRRSVGVTATVLKSAAGAAEYTKIAKVTNLNAAIKDLKEKGIWVIGADMGGKPCYESDITGPICLVIGSEGNGISKLVKENCDSIISIPVIGEVSSFNASVAAGIAMYEIVRQRSLKK
jgi:23S rRNA (guanosine2251-2'-O)-methyltransferase